MGRSLTAAAQTEIAKQVTTPILLLELEFTATLRFSSRQDVTWNGVTWAGDQGLRVDGLEPDNPSARPPRISLPNHNLAMSALVLGEGVSDKAARIWALYGAGPYALDDAVALFDGVMDAVPEIGARVTIALAAQGSRTRFAPRIACAPPLCNHLPPAGTIITWGSEHYTLERSA